MRYIGLDVGRDFAHVAVVEGSGTARRLPRLAMGDESKALAATLGPHDTVAIEASTNAWALAELLGRHAGAVVDDPRARRLLTTPGVGLVVAASILAVVGDIGRAGQAHAQGLPCEAAHAAIRSPGPLAGFHARVEARRGGAVAAVATARKLAVLVWHLLTKDEDCRDARADLVHAKHWALDRMAGRPGTRPPQRGATGSSQDRGPARLRGGDDPHHPALRQAVDRVHHDDTPAGPPGFDVQA